MRKIVRKRLHYFVEFLLRPRKDYISSLFHSFEQIERKGMILVKKKILSIMLCLTIIFALSVPAFAAANDVVTDCRYADTSHPYAFFTQKTTSSKLINQYTTGNAVPGTPLTTWSWTGDHSQWFERATFTANGVTGAAWCVWGNPTLVINCKRAGSTPEVNVESALGNLRADIELFYPERSTGGKFRVAPRYIHPNNMYITVGGAMSGGNYLNWTTSGSTFYMYDVGLKYLI